METRFDIPVIPFESSDSWKTWLDDNYIDQLGLWIKLAKKASGIPSVTYAEALDVALCYGWIDGQKRSYDENYFLQKFTPRRKASMWSKRNIEHIARLTAAGLMTPSGIAEVERAQADGRWNAAYDAPSKITVPDYFQEQLDKNQKAKEFFDTLNKTNRYAVLWRLQTAKTEATRNKRMELLLAMLEANEKIH